MIEWIVVEPWGRLGFRDWSGRMFVHCEITKWSPALKRQCDLKWEQFKEEMRGRGVRTLYSAVPMGDKKVRKWQEMFGQRFVKSSRDLALYSQEL